MKYSDSVALISINQGDHADEINLALYLIQSIPNNQKNNLPWSAHFFIADVTGYWAAARNMDEDARVLHILDLVDRYHSLHEWDIFQTYIAMLLAQSDHLEIQPLQIDSFSFQATALNETDHQQKVFNAKILKTLAAQLKNADGKFSLEDVFTIREIQAIQRVQPTSSNNSWIYPLAYWSVFALTILGLALLIRKSKEVTLACNDTYLGNFTSTIDMLDEICKSYGGVLCYHPVSDNPSQTCSTPIENCLNAVNINMSECCKTSAQECRSEFDLVERNLIIMCNAAYECIGSWHPLYTALYACLAASVGVGSCFMISLCKHKNNSESGNDEENTSLLRNTGGSPKEYFKNDQNLLQWYTENKNNKTIEKLQAFFIQLTFGSLNQSSVSKNLVFSSAGQQISSTSSFFNVVKNFTLPASSRSIKNN